MACTGGCGGPTWKRRQARCRQAQNRGHWWSGSCRCRGKLESDRDTVHGDNAMKYQPSLRWLAGLWPLAALLLVGCKENGTGLAEAPPPAVTVSKPVERKAINFDEYE